MSIYPKGCPSLGCWEQLLLTHRIVSSGPTIHRRETSSWGVGLTERRE
uniref:Uncharacterized protein n=1 Tax=Arundo donax TaxID=35708 RepID=A0A0A9F9U8_ARUDO